MELIGNQILGVVFVVISAASTFLMFHLWGFPFDKEKLRSSAPPSLMRLHRVLGYVYLIIYLVLMWHMVPRLWTYQVELPARTVGHLILGMSIGAILIVKIAIVRYFKHMEGPLVPILGTGLFISTVLVVGLALPFSFREASLRSATLGNEATREERLERVRTLLPLAGFGEDADIEYLTSPQGLVDGRDILRSKCVQCHDLRTVLARPRTPDAWKHTVERMAERSTVLNPITEVDQQLVTAYLIAITPTLQRTVQMRRSQTLQTDSSERAMANVEPDDPDMEYDTDEARQLFERTCSQCHSITNVDRATPGSPEEVVALVSRMVGNGLTASQDQLATIIRYIRETYVNGGR